MAQICDKYKKIIVWGGLNRGFTILSFLKKNYVRKCIKTCIYVTSVTVF